MELAIFTVGGFFLGRLLDKTYSTAPLFTAVFLVLGIATGAWGTYKLLVKFWIDENKAG